MSKLAQWHKFFYVTHGVLDEQTLLRDLGGGSANPSSEGRKCAWTTKTSEFQLRVRMC